MINDLNTNTTNLEFTTSGMDLRPSTDQSAHIQCSKQLVPQRTYHVQEKLTDVEGIEVAEKLSKNGKP